MAGLSADFEAFVIARGTALLRFAYLLTRDPGLAEDLVQEAFVRAHRRWDTIATLEHPEAYLRRVIVNQCLSWRRRRAATEVVGAPPDTGTPDGSDALAERDLVWRAIAGLPARQRAVLVLRYYEAMTDRDIAAVLECAEGTVRSLAARAFETLRQHPQLAAVPGVRQVTAREA